MQDLQATQEGKVFPFTLADLVGWTVKRKDGTSTRYVLAQVGTGTGQETKKDEAVITAARWLNAPAEKPKIVTSLSQYCSHTPNVAGIPLAQFGREADIPLRFFIGDLFGAKEKREDFNFIIDGGDVIQLWNTTPIMTGDPQLVKELGRFHTKAVEEPRILKIHWWDRKAPELDPEFWPELNAQLYGDVMTCCQGGHGRSGTSFVCLLMVNAPDYDAADAVTHIRAVHCSRAIEGTDQHNYINSVASYLNREPNVKEALVVRKYKETFLASKKPTAIATRKMLGW